jgi:hypothetical protein
MHVIDRQSQYLGDEALPAAFDTRPLGYLREENIMTASVVGVPPSDLQHTVSVFLRPFFDWLQHDTTGRNRVHVLLTTNLCPDTTSNDDPTGAVRYIVADLSAHGHGVLGNSNIRESIQSELTGRLYSSTQISTLYLFSFVASKPTFEPITQPFASNHVDTVQVVIDIAGRVRVRSAPAVQTFIDFTTTVDHSLLRGGKVTTPFELYTMSLEMWTVPSDPVVK